MAYQRLTAQHVDDLTGIVGSAYASQASEILHAYGHDYTEDYQFEPEIVLIPANADELAKVMAYCYQQELPITPRGGGTGLSGGALPAVGGVVLSTERLNRILSIDEANFQVTVEPAVINQELRDAVNEYGLTYPPDPASKGSSYIGGNLAENAGGPRAVKYGVTSDYVLNLEVVLPDGSKFWTGANTLKNATGYNLSQLIVGSEGTLAVITKAVLKLVTQPKHSLSLLAAFDNQRNATKAVNGILKSGIVPSALEFMERDAIDWVMNLMDLRVPVQDQVAAHLLIEVDGQHWESLQEEVESVYEVLEEYGSSEIYYADNDQDKQKLWHLRSNVAEAVHANSIYKEEDTVVPRASLPELLEGVKEIGERYGFKSVCYGHAGDGNMHVNIIKGDMPQYRWDHELKDGIREIFELCTKLGGTLSGEHGIGYVQREYMDVRFDAAHLQLMRKIKNAFDPKGLLNPKKVLPDRD
jgi:glycolate oxidase